MDAITLDNMNMLDLVYVMMLVMGLVFDNNITNRLVHFVFKPSNSFGYIFTCIYNYKCWHIIFQCSFDVLDNCMICIFKWTEYICIFNLFSSHINLTSFDNVKNEL
eukprot:226846_1